MFANPFVRKTKRIVCFGGGNAMPISVLRGLKEKDAEITAVCSVLDSGGSSGRLRKEYGIISPGDIRRAFLELSDFPKEDKKLFNYRFKENELEGHVLGNLVFLALCLNKESYHEVFEKLNKLLDDRYKILPSTIHPSELVAILENGQEIVGETKIDIPRHDAGLKIKKVFLRPAVSACPQTIRRIEEADMVVIGPGDIYSSLMQIFLVDGISRAIKNSRAKKVYVCNLMTKNGESNGFRVEDFAAEVEKYIQCPLDCVLFQSKKPGEERVRKYKEKHKELLEPVECRNPLPNFLGRDIMTDEGDILHDPKKLADIIFSLM
jgi:uncharacterized cofD-like protein